MNTLRSYINIVSEDRSSDFEYTDAPTKVTATLTGGDSASFTALGKKVERMNELSEEIKALQSEIKDEAKSKVADLFDASDAVMTRVVVTKSFILTLSKDPEETVTPKYKEILGELEKQLTPDLIKVLEALKKKLVTKSQRSPSLSVSSKVSESVLREGIFSDFSAKVMNWLKGYDKKLRRLMTLAGK
jgi:hypothetical protein